MTIEDLEKYIFQDSEVKLSTAQKSQIKEAHEFLRSFSKDKVIYGINTGFGPMAQYRISDDDLHKLQYNLIHSHANGTGALLSPEQTKSVMICRLNTLSLGFSGASPDILNTLEQYIQHKIYPCIPKHGSVGASGDLVQLAHLGLGLIGEGDCWYNDKITPVKEALQKEGIQKGSLHLRDGLALINGTSCMSGIASVNLIQANKLLFYSTLFSSIMNELTASYDDSFSETLNEAKLHTGQRYIAKKMRTFLQDGNVLKNRVDHLFNQENIKDTDFFTHKVQEYYSLRCVPQIIGPIYDTYLHTKKVVEEEINSGNDNPIVSVEKQNVFHGGNFHGDYIGLEMDKLKIALTRLSMLAERQLNYLLNHKLNEKFPPFLNAGTLGLNFGLQGMQFTAVSTTAENQTLSNPMYVHSISNNGDNQDIVSMGTNAALLCEKVIENAFEVLAIQGIAIAQAMDIHGSLDKFSSLSQKFYQEVREIVPFIVEDQPLHNELNHLKNHLKTAKEKLS